MILRIARAFKKRGKRREISPLGAGFEARAHPHSIWEEAHQLLVEWANRSSHKGTLTEREAIRLIDCCQETLGYFICPDCGKPIWLLDRGTDYNRCYCGKLRWKK